MTLYLYNSLSHSREQFIPLNTQKISMYVCGPTVYDRPHIGNIRSIVVYDVIFRILQQLYGKDQVLYVRNITDVDDKINQRALERNIDIDMLTNETITMFNQDTEYLNCQKPSIEPKATEHIDVMIDIITRLIDKNIAYQQGKYVFFDISKYSNYGKLAGRKIDDLIAGARIEVNLDKKNPGDFILWKPADENTPKSAIFDSPFGPGRPGWHIECSAMSYKYLGENFDIHGGGADLMFPHHTNEIAQSCCAFEGSNFAKYWIHNGFLTYNGEKMSKSLGNIVTVEDFRKQKVSGEVLRLMLLSTHYRKPMDFNDKLLYDSQKIYDYLKHSISDYISATPQDDAKPSQEFIDILCEDLNTPKAIAYLHNLAKQIHSTQNSQTKQQLANKLLISCDILGICLTPKQLETNIGEARKIQLLVDERQNARAKGDWALADRIRRDLLSQGVALEDLADGSTTWSII